MELIYSLELKRNRLVLRMKHEHELNNLLKGLNHDNPDAREFSPYL